MSRAGLGLFAAACALGVGCTLDTSGADVFANAGTAGSGLVAGSAGASSGAAGGVVAGSGGVSGSSPAGAAGAAAMGGSQAGQAGAAGKGGKAGAGQAGASGAGQAGQSAGQAGAGGVGQAGAGQAGDAGAGQAGDAGQAGAGGAGQAGASGGGQAGAGQAGAGQAGAGGSLCGNAKRDPGEECDDGNTDLNDGCNADCTVDCAQVLAQAVKGDSAHCYWTVTGADWNGSRLSCESKGGHLATIGSAAENTWIAGFMPGVKWIGASDGKAIDNSSSGNWAWTTGEPFNPTYWGNNEPNTACHGDDVCCFFKGSMCSYEHCAQQLPNGAWNDALCNSPGTAICEWDPPG